MVSVYLLHVLVLLPPSTHSVLGDGDLVDDSGKLLGGDS